MLQGEEIHVMGSNDFRALAERIAALAAIQVRTSESLSQVMKGFAPSDALAEVPKGAASNRVAASSPNDDYRKPPESPFR